MGIQVAGPEIVLGLNTSAATAASRQFGATVDETTAAAVRSYAKLERQLESTISRLDRQNATFGKSKTEIRDAAVEMLVYAGNAAKSADGTSKLAEAAGRLSTAHRELIANDRAAATAAAEQAASIRDAAIAHQQFEARVKAGVSAMKAEEAAAAAAKEAAAIRDAAIAYQQFEARARSGAAAIRAEEAAAANAKEAAAVRDAAIAYQQFEARVKAGAAAMREDEAAAKARAESVLAAQLKREADEHARLTAAVRGSHDAQMADAAAAEKLRASTDPLYAATKRLNDEIAESTRLYHAGATAPAEYARQQEVLAGRLRQVGKEHEQQTQIMKRGAGTMTQLSFQINDVATMAAMGAKPMQIFASQAGQIFQIAQMAEGGVSGFARQVSVLALAWAPAIAALSVFGVAFYRWQQQTNDDSGIKKYVAGLGLTHKEMKKLGDVSISTGDMIAGMWKTISDGLDLGGNGKRLMDYLYGPDDMKQIETFVSQIYGVFTGAYAAIIEIWAQIGPAIAAFFKPLVEAATWAADGVMKAFKYVYDTVAGWLQTLKSWVAPIAKGWGADFSASIGGQAGASIGAAFGAGYTKGAKQFVTGVDSFFATSTTNAITASQKRYKEQADKLKADRTPKTDNHAASLAREADAIEAQIVNLRRLADAYAISGAAALIAEAREKAESKAIKQRGDIEAAVDRQIRLTIAQRLADAAKTTASLKDQAEAQERANELVAAGVIPASKAADAVRDQLALLPLLAAQQAATQRGLTEDAARATKAIDDQTAAQKRFDEARASAQFQEATASGNDQLETLREELRLIGETDAARVHALATLKATQEAQKFNPGDRAAYIAQQVQIADLGEANRQAQDRYNDSLTFTADLWDEIARTVSNAARGMADAYGSIGKAIGDVASIYANFGADQERDRQAHVEAIRKAGKDEAAINRENALYAQRNLTAQVGLYGDVAAAAKGFFDKGTAGYKSLQAAEMAFRTVEFAMSVKSMVMSTAETAHKIANSAKASIAKGTEAVVNAMRDIPFPLNIAAAAATAAAVAALGIGITGGFGGGNNLPKANDGSGSVLGDSDAKSDSLRRSIEALNDIDTLTMNYSREMAASLKSIEGQIGGLSSLLVRAGVVGTTLNVKEGFSSSITDRAGGTAMLAGAGAGIGAIAGGPVGAIVGAALGTVIGSVFKGLFGTKKTVVGSGVYGGPQSLGDIMANGYEGSVYADVEKKKKILGLTASTKYSTQYGELDAALEQQFGLILTNFANTIKASADPLGVATDDVTKRLNSFIVDIGKVDLKGLSGDEISSRLEAVFGKAADDMAAAAFPGLDRFQNVGEGAYETLIRVASTVEAVTSSFELLGRKTSIGVDASMALAGLFDSVSDYQSASEAFFETYFTESEQSAAKTAQLAKVFGSLNMVMPDSLASFRQLVEAQDLTTESGRQTYAQLLQLAPAFAEIATQAQSATSAAAILRETADLTREWLELTNQTAELRRLELDQLDPTNRALKEQIYAERDRQTALEAANALASRRADLERQILQLNDDTAALRALDLAAMDEVLQPLQLHIWALQDEAAAASKAAQEAEALAQKQAAIAQERTGLEQQLLQLENDTAELRRREREALDPSNRALYDQIEALKDQQAAAAAAAQAEQERQQAAEQAAKAAEQLRDAWKSVGDTLLDEVKRIRGLSDNAPAQTYASLLSQFDQATAAARGGDQEAAKSLAGLSKELLDAAAAVATSQQEFDRISKVTANSLEDTYRLAMKASGNADAATAAFAAMYPASANDNLAAWQSAALASTPSSRDETAAEVRQLRQELKESRAEHAHALEQIAVYAGRSSDVLELALKQGGGDGIAVAPSTDRDVPATKKAAA